MISVVKEATRILKTRIKEGTDLDQGATRGISYEIIYKPRPKR